MLLTFPCLLFLVQIKNAVGDCGCQKDANLQLNQILMNRDLNKQINSITTPNFPYGVGLSPLNGQAISITNGLSNGTPLLDADYNNLLANLRILQNFNNLPINDVLSVKENGGVNVLKLKHQMAFTNNGPQQTDYPSHYFLNNYLSSPVLNSLNSNNMPFKNISPNNIQLISAISNIGSPINQQISSNKLLDKSPSTSTSINSQENLLAMLNELQKKHTFATGKEMNPITLVNRNIPVMEQISLHSQGLPDGGRWYNDFVNTYPSLSDIDTNNQYSPKLPMSLLDDIPFHIKNGKGNNWFLGRNIKETNSAPKLIKNNDFSHLNVALNNPISCGFPLQQHSTYNKQLQIDNNLSNSLIVNNKSPTNVNVQTENLQNWLNCIIPANGNVMQNQLALMNSNDMPIDKQMIDINRLLSNNYYNQNFPILSITDVPLSDTPDFSNYMAPVIANLPISDTDFDNLNTPVGFTTTNVLNLGEFGSLPIINGLPIARIVETVTVLNPNPNCT